VPLSHDDVLQLAERDLASFALYFPRQRSRKRRIPVTISPVVSATRSAFGDTKEWSTRSKRPWLSRTSFVASDESKTDIVRGFSFIAAADLEESGS